MTPWKIVAVTWTEDNCFFTLERDGHRRRVYLTAGIVAATGCSGPRLYDGKPAPEGTR